MKDQKGNIETNVEGVDNQDAPLASIEHGVGLVSHDSGSCSKVLSKFKGGSLYRDRSVSKRKTKSNEVCKSANVNELHTNLVLPNKHKLPKMQS